MADNGQQLWIYLPLNSGKVRVSGSNQNGEQVEWNGDSNEFPYGLGNPNRSWGARTDGWWWKGPAQIWWNDSSGTTHNFATNVPVNQPAAYFSVAFDAPGGIG